MTVQETFNLNRSNLFQITQSFNNELILSRIGDTLPVSVKVVGTPG